MELKFTELHSPLFLAGTNLGMKLDPTKRQGLALAYEREAAELLVTYNGQTAIVPLSNVVSMVAGTPQTPVGVKSIPMPKVQAQVSGPQMHVFEGKGKGKTGQEKA